MLTRRKSIVSCFVIGALLCTLTSCGDKRTAASESVFIAAEAGLDFHTGTQDIRKASLEENTREIVKAAIKSTEQGKRTVPPEIAVVRIAGASVRGGAADYETVVQSESPVQTAGQSENRQETTAVQTTAVQTTENQVFAVPIAPELENKVVTTVDTYQNIRKEPSGDSEIVGRLYAGSAGSVLETEEGWTKISSGDVEGWVHNGYVVSGAEAQEFAEQSLGQVAVVKEDGIRVRAGASVDSAWIGVVNADELYTVVPEEEDTEETEEEASGAPVAEAETAETEASEPSEESVSLESTEAQATESLTVSAETPAVETAQAEVPSETAPAEWVKIIYDGDQEGYVCADYVTTEFSLGEAKSMEEIRAEEKAKAEAEARAKAEKAEKTRKEAAKEEAAAPAQSDSGWVSLGEFEITAYCGGACCNGKWAGTTASGASPREGRTIAVAPWIIPYGTQVKIAGLDNIYVAEDTGGFANSNPYQIDLFFADHSRTGSWGVRYREVWVKR